MANYRISPNAKDELERFWRYGVDRWSMEAADAYQGAEEAFVNDFVAAWAKVMQSDRFDLRGGREMFAGN